MIELGRSIAHVQGKVYRGITKFFMVPRRYHAIVYVVSARTRVA